MEQYAYTGDIKRLKSIGYTFQKLYAMNYKSYHKGDNFMFVVSKMVLEISNLNPHHQVACIDFIIKNRHQPKSFWVSDRNTAIGCFRDMPNFHLTKYGRIVDDATMTELRIVSTMIRINANNAMENGAITHGECGEEYLHAESLEGGLDPYCLTWGRIQMILELNALHPLEKIIT